MKCDGFCVNISEVGDRCGGEEIVGEGLSEGGGVYVYRSVDVEREW